MKLSLNFVLLAVALTGAIAAPHGLHPRESDDAELEARSRNSHSPSNSQTSSSWDLPPGRANSRSVSPNERSSPWMASHQPISADHDIPHALGISAAPIPSPYALTNNDMHIPYAPEGYLPSASRTPSRSSHVPVGAAPHAPSRHSSRRANEHIPDGEGGIGIAVEPPSVSSEPRSSGQLGPPSPGLLVPPSRHASTHSGSEAAHSVKRKTSFGSYNTVITPVAHSQSSHGSEYDTSRQSRSGRPMEGYHPGGPGSMMAARPSMQAPQPYMQAPHPSMQAPQPYMQAPHPYMQAPHPYMQAPHPYMQAPYPYSMQGSPQPGFSPYPPSTHTSSTSNLVSQIPGVVYATSQASSSNGAVIPAGVRGPPSPSRRDGSPMSAHSPNRHPAIQDHGYFPPMPVQHPDVDDDVHYGAPRGFRQPPGSGSPRY